MLLSLQVLRGGLRARRAFSRSCVRSAFASTWANVQQGIHSDDRLELTEQARRTQFSVLSWLI